MPPRPHITLPDRLTISRLHERGYSDAQIAKALGLTPAACREALQDARAVLEASALALVTDYLTASDLAARKGDHRPARDMLDRLHVTDPTPATQAQTNVGVTVQVAGFTLPGLPVTVTSAGTVERRALPAVVDGQMQTHADVDKETQCHAGGGDAMPTRAPGPDGDD